MNLLVIQKALAIQLYSLAVSKPVAVNAETPPDYEAIAKECVERAKQTAPYLFRELEVSNNV